MVRAKELFTWTPSFESIKEHDYSSEDESVQGVGSKENKYNTYEKEESMEHSVHVDKEISADPFGLNDLLGLKKPVEENLEPSPSLSHPPGFSPVGSLNSSDKELNKEFSPTISAKVMNNSQVVHEDVSFNSVVVQVLRTPLNSELRDIDKTRLEDMGLSVQKAKVQMVDLKVDENIEVIFRWNH
ncbi:hypothetical protein Tco_0235772 [Tanacetum coccineum]